jgi:hypothetical protein
LEPWALLQTWDEFGIDGDMDGPEYRDYVLGNDILDEVQGEVRATLERSLLRWLDRVLGRVDDLASLSVARARAEAWDRAARWSRRLDEEAAGAHDRHVGYDSHLILSL